MLSRFRMEPTSLPTVAPPLLYVLLTVRFAYNELLPKDAYCLHPLVILVLLDPVALANLEMQ
jgi:hypothetical protein